MKNVAQIMSDTSKYHHDGGGCIKMSLKLCRIHHESCPKKAPVAIIYIFAKFFEVQPRWHGGDKRGKE